MKPLARMNDGPRARFRRAMSQTNHTQASVAAVMGISADNVKQRLDGRKRFFDAVQLEALRDHSDTVALWRAYMQLECAAGGLCASDAVPDALSDLERLHVLIKESSDVASRYSAALADGRLTGVELGDIEREMVELCDALGGSIAALRAQSVKARVA